MGPTEVEKVKKANTLVERLTYGEDLILEAVKDVCHKVVNANGEPYLFLNPGAKGKVVRADIRENALGTLVYSLLVEWGVPGKSKPYYTLHETGNLQNLDIYGLRAEYVPSPDLYQGKLSFPK